MHNNRITLQIHTELQPDSYMHMSLGKSRRVVTARQHPFPHSPVACTFILKSNQMEINKPFFSYVRVQLRSTNKG